MGLVPLSLGAALYRFCVILLTGLSDFPKHREWRGQRITQLLSLIHIYAVQPRLDDALFVVISQSGKSPDLLRNAEIAKAGGAHVVALVNVADSPLARLADTVLPLHCLLYTSRCV